MTRHPIPCPEALPDRLITPSSGSSTPPLERPPHHRVDLPQNRHSWTHQTFGPAFGSGDGTLEPAKSHGVLGHSHTHRVSCQRRRQAERRWWPDRQVTRQPGRPRSSCSHPRWPRRFGSWVTPYHLGLCTSSGDDAINGCPGASDDHVLTGPARPVIRGSVVITVEGALATLMVLPSKTPDLATGPVTVDRVRECCA